MFDYCEILTHDAPHSQQGFNIFLFFFVLAAGQNYLHSCKPRK